MGIGFCTTNSPKDLCSNLIESIIEDDLIGIDPALFTGDKIVSHFGWCYKRHVVETISVESNLVKINIQVSDEKTCSRCNDKFSKSSIGLICFKCGILSTDTIYNK